MASTSKTKKTKGGLARFVEILWAMVDDENEIKKCGKHISWNESGTGIIIKSRNELALHVLPTYFNTQDFASFHRQLTNYGFKKLQDVERDEFVNENFRRGFPELRKRIIKKKPPDKHQAGCSSDSGAVLKQKGSSARRESVKTHPAQNSFSTSLPRNPQVKFQDSTSPEQLTTKRPPEQMTTAENELSIHTFKKLRASKGVSDNTEKNVAGDQNAGTPLRALGTATAQGRVSEIATRSYQTEGQLQNISYGNADMKESAYVAAQLEPLSFVCHPNLAIQDAKNTTMEIPSHSRPITLSCNVPVKYPASQMNSSWTSEHHNHVPPQQFNNWNSSLFNLSNNSPNVNTQAIQPMETDAHGVNQDLNSSASGRRWASSDKIAVSPQGPIPDDLLESSNFYWRENDSSDSEIDFSNLIALSEMDDSELTSLLSPSGVDSSLTAQASNNVGLHSQNQRHNTIQMPGPLDAMQTQVSHVMRGNNSDSGLGSQSSSSAPQSRHTSDMENSALEEFPAIIKIRPNAVGLSGAPSCEFLRLAELFPEVQSGYATVGNLEKEILWKKGDKHGNGNCIPPSPKPGKQIVKIFSVTGRKLVEAELWYMDPCHHTDDECLVRVGEKASQSYEELFRVMSNILIRCRPQASIKSGESQYSGNSESSMIVQVLRFLINEAAESGLQWDSLPLLEFVAMNHDHENAALFLEERTERYARDITPEGRRRIDLSELLAAINASHEEDEASDTSDGRNDSDSSYDGDVESLLCDSEEPTSDSEDDHSDMLRKVVATGNEIQMGGNNAETDERVILNLPSGYFSGAQIGEKETQPTHSRLKDSSVSLKESVTTERVSDQPFPMSSDSMLPFGKNGKFSRKPIAIKQREKDSKLLQGESRISRIRFHFNNEFPHLTSRKSVRQPIICFLLTTESINRCLSTIEDRWRIQLQLQGLSGRMTTFLLSMLFQAMHIKPEEALKSLSTDADLSSPSNNTSRARYKPYDSPLPSNDSTPSDVVALTSIYRPSGKILLSIVSDRNVLLPPEPWFEDEDCELLMECWKWRRCKNNFLALKVIEIKDQPASSGIRAQGRLATGVYKRPLCEEKGLVKRVPENFILRNWTGKTSLKTSLAWRTNKSRENTEPEPEFLFEEQTSQLICKRSLKKVKSHSSYAEDLSWNPKGSLTVPLKVIEKAKELSKPTDKPLQDCKQVEKAKYDSQEPSTKGMDPTLKLRVPKQPEDIKDCLMSSFYPPVILNTNHQKTLSCAHADNPYHNDKPKHLVESSYGTLKDNAYSKRLKDPLVVDNKKSESSENVENILSFAERLPPTMKDLKKPQPMRGDVPELKSVIGEKQQDKTKPDNNEERCTCSKEAEIRDALFSAIKALEQELSRLPIMPIGQERFEKTIFKRCLKGQSYSSYDESGDGIIRVVSSQFRVATEIWNTGQEEQGVGSDSADLYHDSAAQKVADHSRGDKAEQITFERSVGNSSSSNAAAVRGSKIEDGDDDVQPLTETPADQGTWPYLLEAPLPPEDLNFGGRQGKCEEIIQNVTSGSNRLVSIWGSPGFGKSSVAISVGHSLQSRGFPVYWISLRGLHSKDDLTSKFLSVFRKPIINGQSFHQSVSLDDELRQLFSVVSNRSVFILDDADDLLEGGSPKVKEEVALLLEELQNQGVAFLLTTRESLEFVDKRFAGHRDFRIGPLDEPSAQSLVYKLLPGTTAADCARITQTCEQVSLVLEMMCSAIRDSSTQPRQFLDDFMKPSMFNMENIMDNSEYATSHRIRLQSTFESFFPETL